MSTEEGNIWKRVSHDALKYKKVNKKKCDTIHFGIAFGIILMLSIGSLGVVNGQEDFIGDSTSDTNSLETVSDNLETVSNSQETITDASTAVTNRRLTFSSSIERQPSWSTDSRSISFMSRSAGWQIKKTTLDGSSIITLPGGTGGIEPAWHPSNKIAFSRGTSDSTMDVYVMNNDGTNVIKLTNTPQYDEYPDWNRDATKIAYVSQWSVFNGRKYISVMNADGSNKRNLNIVGIQPSWNPDGTKIAYKCYEYGMNICVVNADGSNKIRLTSENTNTQEPDWSPDGRYITYASKRDGDWEIYVMDADGSNKRQLTSNNVDDNYPSWSPDGQYIAYSLNSSGNEDIWVMSSPSSSGISVTSPDGGENWRRGTTHNITWTSAGSVGSSIKIELLKNGVLNRTISSSTTNDGSYSWAIPSIQTTGIDYKIRVTSTTTTYADNSNNNFTISI